MSFREYCSQLTRKSRSNFYYSFLFLSKEKREAMYAVYAFCRSVDDVADGSAPLREKQTLLDEWRRELDRCYDGNPQHPITVQLARSIRRFPIPKEHFEELITGVEMDLIHSRYPTFHELYEYCYRVAGVVGLMCIEIFGYRNPKAKDYAVNLGLALQLTNIIRDLKVDAERGRIYLPQDELARFGYHEDELLRGAYTPAFFELIRFAGSRARQYFHSARQLLAAEDRRSLFAAEIMGTIYYRLLDTIEASGYRVFDRTITLPTSHKLWIALSIWARSSCAAIRR
ncbi:MAG: presqualene diphosphate synthase HpnD [Candidatus Tectomicrobia bacterium]|nr:presqualene diphosphate synthase HpnD [Candidatus Tectomicrobia bacterium]HEX2279233.1 presqualene diphosphate synthase HpnD [Candidatus Tectomicrobia bacterium]